jgi:hypothetical protein
MSNKPQDNKAPQINKSKKVSELTDKDLGNVSGGTIFRVGLSDPPVMVTKPSNSSGLGSGDTHDTSLKNQSTKI